MGAELHSAELVPDIEGAEPASPMRCVIASANHLATEGMHVSAELWALCWCLPLDSVGPVIHR